MESAVTKPVDSTVDMFALCLFRFSLKGTTSHHTGHIGQTFSNYKTGNLLQGSTILELLVKYYS